MASVPKFGRKPVNRDDPQDWKPALNSFSVIPEGHQTDMRSADWIGDLHDRLAKDAIVFERPYPPQLLKRYKSFFGGQPKLPAGQTWPLTSRNHKLPELRGKAMNFLAQIDLESLPHIPALSLLPKTGTLYFFADTALDWLREEVTERACVIFSETANHDLTDTPQPKNSLPCYGLEFHYRVQGAENYEEAPANFVKWGVKPHVVETFVDQTYKDMEPWAGELSEEEQGVFQKLWQQKSGATMTAVFPVVEAVNDKPVYDRSPAIRKRFNAPFSWRFIDYIAAYIIRSFNDESGPKSWGNGVPPHAVAEIIARARSWRNLSLHWGFDTAPTEAEKARFQNWIDELLDFLKTLRVDFSSSIYGCWAATLEQIGDLYITKEGSIRDLAPDDLYRALRDRHAVLTSGTFVNCTMHMMGGNGKGIQATDVDLTTHVLLLQLDSDYGINWMWGDVGTLTFWISKKDLAARRFDKAFMTMAGH
jgi:uncharacterized protein YwqG